MSYEEKLSELYDSIEQAIVKAAEADNNDLKFKLYDILVEVQEELNELDEQKDEEE